MCLCVVKICFCTWRWCCVFGLFVFCLSFDGTGGHMVRLKRENLHDLQKYLADFGYMERSKDGAFALRTEESVLDALKELQDFAGLPITGKLDGPTRRLLRTPRCGLPDKDGRSPAALRSRTKRFTIHGPKWPYTSLTWSLRSKNVGNLDQYQVRFVISKALEVWSKHSQLTFTEVDSDKADIVIYFYRGDHGDNFPFDGRGLVLAHAFFPTGMRSSIEVHFDADEAWTTTGNSEQGTNLFNVAAHEIGHSLGLSHSKVESALMYPWYKEMENGFDYELPDDDKQAIQFLYGARDDRRVWMKIPEYHPNPTTTTTSTTTTTTTTTSTTTPRPRIYHTRQPQQPYDPRYPHGRHPFPYHPQKPSYYPQKPMHPDKKPHYPKHSGEQYPYGPDRKHPHHKHVPERTPDRVYPTRGYPTNNPDKYIPHHPPTKRYPLVNPNPPKESPTKKAPPDTCDTSYDAVAVIRREVFIFKDAYFWRIGESGLMKGYPAEIRRLWHGLPYNLTNVDAVYERTDGKIVFFIGDIYYVFSNNNVERGYPKSLTNLGLTEDVKKIDGAMVWGHNGKTYFYSGDMYWRFDEDIQKVELDYPRHMSMWKGVGTDIDAVFQWKDGKTYFFKGKGFWKFNDLHMRVEHIEPKLSAPFWMGCSTNYEENDVGHKLPYTHEAYSHASYNTCSTLLVSLYVVFMNLRLIS